MNLTPAHFLDRLRRSRLLPTIETGDVDWPTVLASCERAGLVAVEVLLRGPDSMALLRTLSGSSTLLVGAGTVTSAVQCKQAIAAGADFIVCPGLDAEIARIAMEADLPILPGIATPTEIMTAMNLGLSVCKFFPAEAIGGTNRIKAFQGPFPNIEFLPTGGINMGNVASYLALPSVAAVGGGFILPPELLSAGRVSELEQHLDTVVSLAATPQE